MSRLIFNADTLGGTTTLSSADAVGNFTLTVPAVNGTLSVKDASNDATFRNITLTGAVLAGAWNGSTITVPFGGTGATTLTGYVKGNGTSAMTASATIPNTDITGLGTMSVQGSDAVTITGGTANGLTIGASNPAAATVTTLRINSTLSLAGATGTSGQVLTSNGASAPTWQNIAGSGTVTSIDVSGGTTGLTTSGGPVTGAGTITLAGTLAIANGGTGATSAANALTALGAYPATNPSGFGVGTVTSVAGAGTVNGLTLTGTVTSSGSLTLGGTLDLSSPPAIGGTTAAAGSFTTLNSSGATRLGGLSGNQSLQINNVASAVNYAQIVGAVTGSAPLISAIGTDTNIPLVLQGQGTGVVALGGTTAANSGFVVNPTTSSVNYLQVGGGATGSAPAFRVNGTDTNIGLAFTAKGSSNITFQGFSFGQFILALKPTASAVNLVQIQSATTGNGPTISTDGSDTNIGLTLTPKGTGVVSTTSITLSNTLTTAAYTETIVASGTVGASATLAITAGTVLTATLTSATPCTFTMPTATAGKSFTLLLKQPASGTPTTATFTGVKWNSGGAPTITATLGRLDIIAFVADGTNWYGTASQGYTY
jgi:hypothetical protein